MNRLKFNCKSVRGSIKLTAVLVTTILSLTFLTVFLVNERTETKRIYAIQEMVKSGVNPIVAACSMDPYDGMGKSRPECLNK